jgi:hypothetical protein
MRLRMSFVFGFGALSASLFWYLYDQLLQR